MVSEEIRHKIMVLLENRPEMSQRELAQELNISLGKANYCIRALIRQGAVKAANFKNSKNRKAYMYVLTPLGIEQKASLAVKFLKIKMQEYDLLRREIEELRREADRHRAS